MPASSTPAAVDAVQRTVDLEDLGPSVRVTTSLRTTLGDAPSALWPMLTRPALLETWYGPVTVADGAFEAVGGAHGGVLEAEAPHRLRLSWEYGTNVDDLAIALDPEDDGTTELRLVHVADVPHEVFDRFGPGATALGWDIALLGLAARTGAWRELCLDVPAPSAVWLASEDGARYVRAWSIRWAAASVAAGTDETVARRGEVETARAYGGLRDVAAV